MPLERMKGTEKVRGTFDLNCPLSNGTYGGGRGGEKEISRKKKKRRREGGEPYIWTAKF